MSSNFLILNFKNKFGFRYIESLYEAKQQRTISNWDESLKANYKNTVVNYKKVPYNWLKVFF